jgi:hypothetical protein
MLFKRRLLQKILSGEKTQTRRPRGSTKEVGDKMGVRNHYEPFKHYVLITRKFKQRLGDISEQDAHKEGFQSIDEFKAAWINIYGSWKPNQVVTVLEFKLV